MSSKQEIRDQLLKKRKDLSSTDKRKFDICLNSNLEEAIQWINLPDNANVLGYLPIESNQEADITPMLELLRENGANIFLPRVKNDEIEIVKINTFKDVEIGKFSIPEPSKALTPCTQSDFDLIVVPGIAFDKECNRIGYGKGFYDKILKKISGLKIGVAFDFQIIDKIETDDFDVKMDIILTDKGFYK